MVTATILTESSILAARLWFHDNALACIEEVLEGEVKVNDPEGYFKERTESANAYLIGSIDHTFTFKQCAYFIQTGECCQLLPYQVSKNDNSNHLDR